MKKSKGYCKIICSQLMTILREWNVDVLRLESVGGISGNKCYIRSFLISGYNYVHIINDDMKLIMNREEGENWIIIVPKLVPISVWIVMKIIIWCFIINKYIPRKYIYF